MKTPGISKWFGMQHGFTLIELLVALALTTVIMSGVVQVLTVSKSNFITGRELAMSQENARYAMRFISDEIRMAGFTGCTSKPLGVVNTIIGARTKWFLGNPGVSGFEHEAGLAGFPDEFRADAVANTDALIVRRGIFDGLRITVDGINFHNPNSANLPLNKAIGDLRGQAMVIATPDCQHVGVFQVTGPNSANPTRMVHNTGGVVTPGNCEKYLGVEGNFFCGDSGAGLLALSYKPGSLIGELRSEAFYIGTASGGIPALFRERLLLNSTTKTLYTEAEELVRGVENLQVAFGIDTQPAVRDGLADKYVDADDPDLDPASGDPDTAIVSIRLSLRMRSQLPVYTQPVAFGEFEGVDGTDGADRFLRQDITTTITVRNF